MDTSLKELQLLQKKISINSFLTNIGFPVVKGIMNLFTRIQYQVNT